MRSFIDEYSCFLKKISKLDTAFQEKIFLKSGQALKPMTYK